MFYTALYCAAIKYKVLKDSKENQSYHDYITKKKLLRFVNNEKM